MKETVSMIAAVIVLLASAVSPVSAMQTPDFRLKDTKGQIHTLERHKGKWVIINFWATWCPPCLKEIPDLISLHRDRKDIVIIGIAIDYQNPGTVLEFAQSLSVNYPVVLGDKKIAAQIGPLSMLPTTYVFNPAGKPAVYKVGLISRADIEGFIRDYPGNMHKNLPAKHTGKPGRED